MSWQIPGSSITCSLGVGCQETGICYAEAHGQPEQCGVTIVDGIDLSAIKPLTEAEAEDYFSLPTMFERYQTALDKLGEEDRLAVTLYVDHLKRQINSAYGQGRSEAWTRPGFGEMGG